MRYNINKKNTERWKDDVGRSVRFYNDWFTNFAPATFINARNEAIKKVEAVFNKTDCLNKLSAEMLLEVPETLQILRMATTPPIARDRLTGLAYLTRNFVKNMEEGKLPKRMEKGELTEYLSRTVEIIDRLLDRDLMPWLEEKRYPKEIDRMMAAQIIADRLCGSLSDPIIRNEQERRQLDSISRFLDAKGYRKVNTLDIGDFRNMQPGTYAYHLNVAYDLDKSKKAKTPIDVAIMRQTAKKGIDMPILIECKSAGDFTNTNKRRKEESDKIIKLKRTYGKNVEFILFLCGYFDSGYLGFEAADGIDWVWEHRIEDMDKMGL